jgi:hypothetical protein
MVSKNTIEAARATDVSVAARAVPDTRVINVVTEGGRGAVQPALGRMLAVIERQQAELNDAWELRILQGAQPPEQSGASAKLLLIAVLLLAALGALLTYSVLTRLLGTGRAGVSRSPRWAEPDEHEDARLTGAPHSR